ncbi:hypothetical protein PYCC9005_004061 [Savitreella phatthalungensis]
MLPTMRIRIASVPLTCRALTTSARLRNAGDTISQGTQTQSAANPSVVGDGPLRRLPTTPLGRVRQRAGTSAPDASASNANAPLPTGKTTVVAEPLVDPGQYHLHCLTTHSNTRITLTNHAHEVVMWTSAGVCGFKKAQRGGFEAGFRAMCNILERMREKEDSDAARAAKERAEPNRVNKVAANKRRPPFRPRNIDLILSEFGVGREAVTKALLGVEGNRYRPLIRQLIDTTPIRFGGVRPRAVRRL